MANIDKIKEQGNQAAPLLTGLHDNELVIEYSVLGGSPSSPQILNLRGRQNILKYWDLLEKGEVKADDIKVILNRSGFRYSVIKSFLILRSSGNKEFYLAYIETDLVGNPGLYCVEIKYKFVKTSGTYELKISASSVSAPQTKYDITTEFID